MSYNKKSLCHQYLGGGPQCQIICDTCKNIPTPATPFEDKAKKILFGRTDIGDKKWDYEKFIADNPEAKMNEAALHGWKPESQWNDQEMTGLIPIPGTQPVQYWKPQEREYRVWDNKTGESRKANKDEIGEPITIKFERPLKFFQLAKNPQLSEPESSQLVASEKPEKRLRMIDRIAIIGIGDPIKESEYGKACTDALDEIQKIYDYCTEQNISPDQLILDHQTYMALL